MICLQLVELLPLVIKEEGNNSQQTPSVVNAKAAFFFRQSRIQIFFFSPTDQWQCQ